MKLSIFGAAESSNFHRPLTASILIFIFAALFVFAAGGPGAALRSQENLAGASVTFYRDVLPILQQHCQVCHRSGGIAPLAFQTYAETRPYAAAIAAAALTHTMPPWFAEKD